MAMINAIRIDIPEDVNASAQPAEPLVVSARRSMHRKRTVSAKARRLVEVFERFMSADGNETQRAERERYVHPAYQRYAKRCFRDRRVRFGTSKLAARADLLRAAVRAKRRTFAYKPMPRVPLYYCRRCGLASNVVSKLVDHICTKKATLNHDYINNRLQKMAQIGPHTRVRDAHAILERLPNPQWVRLARYSTTVHYDIVQRFHNPSTLMEIAYKNVARYVIPSSDATSLVFDEYDMKNQDGENDEPFEIMEYDGEMFRNCYDLEEEAESSNIKMEIDDIDTASTSDTMMVYDSNQDANDIVEEQKNGRKREVNVINENGRAKNESESHCLEKLILSAIDNDRVKVTPPPDKNSRLESQLQTEFDSWDSSIPNSPELGFPLRSQHKLSANSMHDECGDGRETSKDPQPGPCTIHQLEKSLQDEHMMEKERKIAEQRFFHALNGVGYFCRVCNHVFATFANYDWHMAWSETYGKECAKVTPDPVEVSVSSYKQLPECGRHVKIRQLPVDPSQKWICTKCHRDFTKRADLHTHIFECATV